MSHQPLQPKANYNHHLFPAYYKRNFNDDGQFPEDNVCGQKFASCLSCRKTSPQSQSYLGPVANYSLISALNASQYAQVVQSTSGMQSTKQTSPLVISAPHHCRVKLSFLAEDSQNAICRHLYALFRMSTSKDKDISLYHSKQWWQYNPFPCVSVLCVVKIFSTKISWECFTSLPLFVFFLSIYPSQQWRQFCII